MRIKQAFAGALLPIGVALAGVALSGGIAQAQIDSPPDGPHHWCPGEPQVTTAGTPNYGTPVNWDNTVCHEYWYVNSGYGNVAYNIWDGPNPPGADIPPPGPPLPPGLCWPRGGTFIPVPVPCPR